MNEENYKRACEIKQELSILKAHKYELRKMCFTEYHGELSFRANEYNPQVKLISEITPNSFESDYIASLDARIRSLENEFEKL